MEGQYEGLALPTNARIILTVISGPAKGNVYKMEKPRVVIGRTDADIVLNDTEVSRWHCSIEVKDKIVRLRDLDSTLPEPPGICLSFCFLLIDETDPTPTG